MRTVSPVEKSKRPASSAVGQEYAGGDSGYEVSFLSLATVLLRNWRLLVLIPVFLVAVTVLLVLSSERTYVARASFVPQSGEGSSMTAATGLARQFGLDVGRDRIGQSPQFYVDLLNGQTILRMAAQSEYAVAGPDPDGRATLIEILGVQDGRRGVTAWQRAVEKLRRRVHTSVARETGIVTLSVSSTDPQLAEQIAARLLELMNEFNIEARQQRALDEGRFVSERLDEARRQLTEAEQAQEQFLSRNRAFQNSPELMLEYERLERQILMRQEVYTSLLRTYEQVRIDAVRDTPLLTVIDRPAASPEGRRGMFRVALAAVIGVILGILIALLRESLRGLRESESERYDQARQLLRQTWRDVRNPFRWFRPRSS